MTASVTIHLPTRLCKYSHKIPAAEGTVFHQRLTAHYPYNAQQTGGSTAHVTQAP